MKYKCENELNTFNFRDFGVMDIGFANDTFSMLTGGAIAKYDNSCNETLEERYISDTQIRIVDCQIEKFFLEGGKYYDANDVLLSEEPDKEVEKSAYKEMFKKIKDGESTVFFVGEKSAVDENGLKTFEICIDITTEDTIDTYWLVIKGSKIIIEFDRFMNRVMN